MLGRKVYLMMLFIGLSFIGYSQRYSYKKKFGNQQNAMYLYWGYNRSIYTKSNINFYSPTYNFTLMNAAAKDNPCNDAGTYFNPSKFTVPQFSVRIGWYYKHRWDFSLGYDHFKYVMRDWQHLYVNGVIEGTTNSSLNGVYTDSDGKILIKPDDLHYENSNGLNYISLQLNNTAPLYKTNNKKFVIHRRFGGGFGPVITQTDFNWDGEIYHSTLKFAGYGISLNGGVRFDFWNRFFVLNNFSTGFIHLPKNATIQRQEHYARHKFMYASWEIAVGVLWYVRTKNGCDTCPDWH
ncbi:hypothetical protein K6119_13230 [Paracrocinitomix mangrovi]|uniref:hypothetical protein n=1 Tax=Paracrocinitomix mangrovi TaxID=2862509 RepID=UPI001C8EBD45|nr:hypothetical protein [Paracrocinitomix mangrovi]UKN00693.1 hypothetical protein K6119_13230 [Paracrocinitomix mangrovi]